MKVIIVEPHKKPYATEISSGLQSLQSVVGGDIEAIYPFDDPVALICNEEGKIEELQLNRALYDEDGEMFDIIAGTFLIVGLTEEDFGGLNDELVTKYLKRFESPETFHSISGKVVVINN